jgi:peptidoglycan/LPS O-acetylase OafA/YrhL
MWRLKEDVYSLFQQQKYAPIDGMRAISCLMIVSIHIGNILNAFIPPYPHMQWMTYLSSYSYRFSSIFSLALETFFILSGFLLTLKFIQHRRSFSWREYPMYILKRAYRFWPGILLTTIVMLILGEPEGNWTSFWLFYQNYVSMEQWSGGFAALWSVSLDMQMHIILPLILHIITSSKSNYRRTYSALYILVILSVMYSILVFNPKTMNIPALVYYNNLLGLLMPQRIFDWIKTEYNVTLAFEKPNDSIPMKPFMDAMYLPILSRYSSFIIGSILAFTIIDVKNKTIISNGKIKKYTYLILISLFMLILATPTEPNTINDIVLTITFSIIRQIFSIAQAFILFSTICPSTHPYHSPWIKSFLSLSIWTPIARLSYLIYVLHFRIAFELIMTNSNLFDPKHFSIDGLTLICLALVLTISLFVSVVWFIFVEKPFERFINTHLSSTEKSHAQ